MRGNQRRRDVGQTGLFVDPISDVNSFRKSWSKGTPELVFSPAPANALPISFGKESKNRPVTYCWNVLEFVASRTTITIRIARQANSMIGSDIAPRITAKP